MMCKHCKKKPCSRPRGLCRSCYFSPSRYLYPVTSSMRRGLGLPMSSLVSPMISLNDEEVQDALNSTLNTDETEDAGFEDFLLPAPEELDSYNTGPNGRPIAPWPTDFVPGTDGKLRTLISRSNRGYELWHPDDATYEKRNAV